MPNRYMLIEQLQQTFAVLNFKPLFFCEIFCGQCFQRIFQRAALFYKIIMHVCA